MTFVALNDHRENSKHLTGIQNVKTVWSSFGVDFSFEEQTVNTVSVLKNSL